MADHPDNAHLPVVNRPETIRAVTLTFLIIASVAVGLRLYVRAKDRLWGWDDLFVVLAALITVIGSSLTCIMADDGMGHHFWTLSPDMVRAYFKHIWATNTAYTVSTACIKLSILFQYLRLFDFQAKLARWLTLSLLVVTALWGITFFLLALFACVPIKRNWDLSVPGKCVAWGSKDPNVFFASWAAHAASNMSLDVLILILPIPFLKSLQMQGKTRFGLVGLFSVGGVVVLVSIARLVALCVNRVGTVPIFDPSYATPTVFICSILEVNLATVCASIPIFWPLVVTLTSNKILVETEVEVRTDYRDSRRIGLAEQGASVGMPGLPSIDAGSTLSHISVSRSSRDTKDARTNTRMTRSSSSTRGRFHKPKRSDSSDKEFGDGIELNRHISHESHRDVAGAATPSLKSTTSSLHPEEPSGPLETARNGTVAPYLDRYVQDWAIPDFDNMDSEDERRPKKSKQSYSTTIKALEK